MARTTKSLQQGNGNNQRHRDHRSKKKRNLGRRNDEKVKPYIARKMKELAEREARM